MTDLRAAALGMALSLTAVEAAAAPMNFTIAMIPDTQVYAYAWANRANPNSPAQALFAAFPGAIGGALSGQGIMAAQTAYLRDNAAALNLKFVTHVGDITQGTIERNEATPENRAAMPQHNIPGQWMTAKEAFQILKDAGIPSSVAIGNHDDSEDGYNDLNLWKQTFGATGGFYTGAAGHLGFSANERNSAQLIDVGGGQTILHLSLDYLETQANQDERAAFAQTMIDAHPGVPTMITTHKNVDENGMFQTAGQDLLDRVVTPNEQVFLVLNGHYTSGPFEFALAGVFDGAGEQVVVTQNAAGRDVYHVLANYQFSVPISSGYMRLIEFDFLNGSLDMTTVSPLSLDERIGGSTAFGSTDPFAFGTTARFSLPVDFAAIGFMPTPVPLPAGVWLLGGALLSFAALRRRAA